MFVEAPRDLFWGLISIFYCTNWVRLGKMLENLVLQPRFEPGTYKYRNVMLLLHQTLNQHLKLVTQVPTGIIH